MRWIKLAWLLPKFSEKPDLDDFDSHEDSEESKEES